MNAAANVQPAPAQAPQHGGAPPAWVLASDEGKRRGFRNPLAFRRWCRARGVELRKDGKLRWVRPKDVDDAVEGLRPGPAPAPVANDPAAADRAAAVAAFVGRR